MTVIPATVTTELIQHADGRPVAYVDATGVAVFAYQEPDGTYVIEICTRDDIPLGGLRVLVDGNSLMRPAGFGPRMVAQQRTDGICATGHDVQA